ARPPEARPLALLQQGEPEGRTPTRSTAGHFSGASRARQSGAKDADALALQLDHLACLEPAPEIGGAAAAERARPVDVAREDVLAGRHVGDHLRKRPVRIAEVTRGPYRPV